MSFAPGTRNNLKIVGLLSLLTGAFLSVGYFLGGTGGMVIALLFAAVMNFGSYWFSDKIVLKIYRATEIPKDEKPELHETLEELAENAGIPKPRLYRNDMKVPNAFATGRSPEKGVVCVTDGLMNQLDDEEVAAVIAHELAHIKNRDSLINAAVATLAGAVAIVARIAFWGAMFSSRDENAGEMIAGLAFMIITPVIALLIRTAISRKMEFRADSNAVQIQGEKEHMISALEKISSANKNTRYRASQVQEVGSNLFIENPFSGDHLTKYFSTHPPLENRVKNIRETSIK